MPVVALPGIVAVAVAIFALGVLWAIKYFTSGVGHLIPANIPVIGKFLRNAVLYVAGAAQAGIQWIMAEAVKPIVGFVLAPVYRFMDFLSALEGTVHQLSINWGWLLNTQLPALYKAAKAYAHGLYTSVHAYAKALYVSAGKAIVRYYGYAKSYAHGLYLTLGKEITRYYGYAKSYAYTRYKEALAYTLKYYAKAESYAKGLVAASQATVLKEVHTLEATVKATAGTSAKAIASSAASTLKAAEQATTAAVNAGITAVDIDGVKGIAAEWPGIIEDVSGLEGVIATDLPAIGAAVRAIPTSIPVTVSGAIAATAAISDVMVRYMRDCGVPNCRNLSKIGRDLQELFSVVEGASFLALLAEIAADPQGAAHDAESFLGPVASDLGDAAKSLLGI